MTILFDADSLIFASCYRTRINGEKPDDIYYRDIRDAQDKYSEQFMKMINDLDEHFDIQNILTFSGSSGNFRKMITPTYKANRKKQEKPPLLYELHNFVKQTYNSIYTRGLETDDLVAANWNRIKNEVGRDQVLIVSIDKDYKQFPAMIYNYVKKEIYDITEDQALYNFYSQCVIGDSADNVNYFKGKGVKFAEKYYKGCKTKYQYTRKLYELFKQEYKSKAKEKYSECYHLLKLRI